MEAPFQGIQHPTYQSLRDFSGCGDLQKLEDPCTQAIGVPTHALLPITVLQEEQGSGEDLPSFWATTR